MAARGSNPFYHQDDSQLGTVIGATLGRALFGDPEAAAQLAIRKAQTDYYGAQADEARAHGGLYNAQTQGVGIQNDASRSLGDRLTAMFQPPATVAAAPDADPLAPLPAQPPQMDAVRAGLPAVIAAMAQMKGDQVNIPDVMQTLGAFMGEDEMARRGLVAGGHTPGKEFAITPQRADEIAQDGYTADYNKDTAVAKINHYSDVPVANIKAGADRDVARINHSTDIPVANIKANADRDVASIGKTIGFSLVTDALPGAQMTGGERSPQHNAEVGGAAHSYHLPGDGVEAFDVAPGTGARTFADAKAAMQAKYGSRLVEAIDETNRPGHGPHWHFAIADAPGGKAAAKTPAAKAPPKVSAASEKMLAGLLDDQAKREGLNLSPGARANMLTSATTLYQKNGNPNDAIGQVFGALHKNLAARQGGGKQQTAQADAPPVTGARKAPDGHWYVKQGNGYARVDVTG